MGLEDVIEKFNPQTLMVRRTSAGRIIDGYLVPVDELEEEVDLDGATDTVIFPAHGLISGAGPFKLLVEDGDPPSGLSADAYYWVIKIDDDTLKLAASYAAAVATPTPFPIAFGPEDSDATYTLVAPESFPIRAGVQEESGRTNDDQPEGQSTETATLTLYTTTLLIPRMPATATTPEREPDQVQIEWLGQLEWWVVASTKQYRNISRHYVVTIERQETP